MHKKVDKTGAGQRRLGSQVRSVQFLAGIYSLLRNNVDDKNCISIPILENGGKHVYRQGVSHLEMATEATIAFLMLKMMNFLKSQIIKENVIDIVLLAYLCAKYRTII